jgi:hypothetical protein
MFFKSQIIDLIVQLYIIFHTNIECVHKVFYTITDATIPLSETIHYFFGETIVFVQIGFHILDGFYFLRVLKKLYVW